MEQRLGDVVVAAGGHPARPEVAAAYVRRHRHPLGPPAQRLVDAVDVLDVLALRVAADRGDVRALVRVVHVG
ncbi:MAG TPA: hypothetical protein VGJ25_07980, partial [Gaiellaceae bacterium]